jgi:Tfp pilus assembly major pilin PilA
MTRRNPVDVVSGQAVSPTQSAALMHGHTLVELAIAVAVAGVVGSAAYPAYTNYMLKSRWATVVAALRGADAAMHECIAVAGAASCDWDKELKTGGTLSNLTLPPGVVVRAASFGTDMNGLRIDGDVRYGECAIGMLPSVNAAGKRYTR